MPFNISPIYFLHYALRREATQFFTSIAIRYLAIGMIVIFEPIYIYLYFSKSLPLALLFFAAVNGLYALLIIFGGMMMAKIGPKHNMLLSHFFFFGYYLCLFFIPQNYLLLPLAIILKAIGMALFWPAFHTDFCRFSQKGYQGSAVGKMNLALLIPSAISPLIGGWILTSFGYPVLFSTVLIVLFTSAIPLFLSREVHTVYTDTYLTTWRRIFKKKNKKMSLAIAATGIESAIDVNIWPIFMVTLAIGYETMGGIATFAIAIAGFFSLYMGKISNRMINRIRFLNIGSALTSIAWIIKLFVTTSFSAFLAQTLYRIFRTTATIPFETFYYRRAALKGPEMDEFLVYRSMLFNIAQSFFFIFLAGFFVFIPQINLSFIMAAVFALGFMLLGVPPKILKRLKWR